MADTHPARGSAVPSDANGQKKGGGCSRLKGIEVPSAGLPEADRGRATQATEGKLAFRKLTDRPGRPRQWPF